ncbi:hypothetical protein CKO28_26955 [Rhodovibrio sodomensis]|uniref:Transposase DDE domain-containing protein n=1 Tax=Rhodovibrio sodomensis TaxID=1088 RepID=A0ABS1DMC5_9PROT|nr:hypothetical protein [Rhodovibrio sodomensis]
MHAGDVRAHRRDLDAVVAELEGLVLGTNVPTATRAVAGRRGNREVGVRLQGPRLTLAALACLAGFTFPRLIRLLVLRLGSEEFCAFLRGWFTLASSSATRRSRHPF